MENVGYMRYTKSEKEKQRERNVFDFGIFSLFFMAFSFLFFSRNAEGKEYPRGSASPSTSRSPTRLRTSAFSPTCQQLCFRPRFEEGEEKGEKEIR